LRRRVKNRRRRERREERIGELLHSAQLAHLIVDVHPSRVVKVKTKKKSYLKN
jgi:hypothetical protein